MKNMSEGMAFGEMQTTIPTDTGEVIRGNSEPTKAPRMPWELDNEEVIPGANKTYSSEIISGDDVDVSKMHRITHDDVVAKERQAATENQASAMNELLGMMDNVINNEKERVAELDKPEVKQMVVEAAKESGTYKYAETVRKEEENPKAVASTNYDDFMPDYDDSDDTEDYDSVSRENYDTTDNMERDDSEDESENQLDQIMADIKNLPTVHHKTEETADPVIAMVRDRKPGGEIVKSNRVKDEGDVAFMNSLSKFKKNNFRTVRVPLVNSGFWADIVGTGAIDLTTLYANMDRGTIAIDYELEKMKATIKGVVATNPKVPMESLRNMIHYSDYQMMAFGRVCATFKTINSMGTCPECNKEFKFDANPRDMLLNLDKLTDRINAMRNAISIDDYSLLSKDRKFEFDESGLTVVVGHPSYVDMVTMYNAMQYYTSPDAGLSKIESRNFQLRLQTLSYVRSVVLPNGVRAANAYQKHLALNMLTTEEFKEVTDTIRELVDQVVAPEFGISGLRCPHCGKEVTMQIGSLEDLVFYHSMVTQSLT